MRLHFKSDMEDFGDIELLGDRLGQWTSIETTHMVNERGSEQG